MWSISRCSARSCRRVALHYGRRNLALPVRPSWRLDVAPCAAGVASQSPSAQPVLRRHFCATAVPPLIVVLDLDECLIHSTDFSSSAAGGLSAAGVGLGAAAVRQDEACRPGVAPAGDGVQSFRTEFADVTEGETASCLVLKRKGVDEFLDSCCANFETYVFTAGTKVYADAILDKLDPGRRLAGRFYRSDCLPVKLPNGEQYLKDLDTVVTKAGRYRDASRIVLVDNNPISFVCQPRNGIWVPDFVGEPDDVLRKVLGLLHKLSNEHDDVGVPLAKLFNLEKHTAPLHAELFGLGFGPESQSKTWF